MSFKAFRTGFLFLALLLAVAGCESSEERAQRFFQSGMELLEAGDTDRALVEFRNVFRLDPRHREARLTYARVQRDRGRTGEAYGQYLRVAEQYPDDLEARIALAEIAIEGGSWDDAGVHARAARDLAPEDPAVVIVNAMLDYRDATLAEDRDAALAPVETARARLAEAPEDLIARRMVVDYAVTGPDPQAALPEIEAAIAAHPDRLEFHMLKLQLIAATGDAEATQQTLETMVDRFPDSEEVRGLLISWYLSQGDLDAAEAFLRRLSEAEGAGLDEKITVVEFLRRTQGMEAASAELDRLIEAEGGNATLQAMRAAIGFEQGRREEALAEMEGLIEGAEPSDETRNLKVALARMLITAGDQVGARARIEEVLAEDPNHVEALKLRAAWLIDDDQPGEAIVALRAALAQAPRDADVLTLMAQAHEREGATTLAGERYALAVDVSGRAPAESLRYAAFLVENDRIESAEAVIEEALAGAPQNVDLLAAMAEIQLRRGEWNRVTRLVWQLRAIGTDAARAAADEIEVERLLRQERVDDTLAFLGELAGAEGASATAAKARMVQIQVRDGRVDEARALLEDELAKTPDDPTLRYLRAGLHLLQDETAEAEAIYRALLQEYPGAERPLVALQGLLTADGRPDEAMAVIDAAIEAAPQAVTPRVLKAGALEARRDFEGAIAIYEEIYADNSANLIVANNLASLITTHRSDAESLDRAFAIARRLRDSDVPAFQDTYGWIEYRRGNYEEALARLEPAARGLPDDPLVQYHLGMTYRALQRTAEARETLTRALGIAGDNPLPQFDEARRVLQELGGE